MLDVKVFLVILNTQQAHRDAYHKKKTKKQTNKQTKVVTWKTCILYVLFKTVFCSITFEYNTTGMSHLKITVSPVRCHPLHRFLQL